MSEGKDRAVGAPKDAGRRALLKAATVAGGAAAASALLPGSWKKPAATLGGLPAHAQTSQTLTLSRPAAFFAVPEAGRVGSALNVIQARCRYEDLLGDFDLEHLITLRVGMGLSDAPAAGGGSVGNNVCGNTSTYALSELDVAPLVDGYTGELSFRVTSECFPAGWIAWSIHKGSQVSNVVNASIGFLNP